ncbi:MAG TPA: porin [Bacteroidales bacterium]|nr:porin [Bacteroidales bacterium]HSA42704.1 porin [Bacteroidales bacterium]
MKKYLIVIALSFSCLIVSDATGQVLLDERAIIRFDHGLGFNAPDTAFGVNIRFRVQNRLNLTTSSDKDLDIKSVDPRISRLRLRFDGYILGSKLTYLFQLGFSRDDVSGNPTGAPNLIRDAIVFYRFSPDFYIGFGQAKLPGNRQEIISSGQQQFIDRSIVTTALDINRDFGLFGYYSQILSGMPFNLKAAVSTGEGRNYSTQDGGLCYTGRLELMPFGKFQRNGDFSEGDLSREETPKLALAAAYSLNRDAVRTNGQTGDLLPLKRDLESFFADLLLKYRGNAFFLEYASRSTEKPLMSHEGSETAVLAGTAFNTQISRLFRNNFEIVARYAILKTVEEVKIIWPDRVFYTIGLNKYINAHMTKFQTNLTYRKSTGPGISTADFYFQVQVELGI